MSRKKDSQFGDAMLFGPKKGIVIRASETKSAGAGVYAQQAAAIEQAKAIVRAAAAPTEHAAAYAPKFTQVPGLISKQAVTPALRYVTPADKEFIRPKDRQPVIDTTGYVPGAYAPPPTAPQPTAQDVMPSYVAPAAGPGPTAQAVTPSYLTPGPSASPDGASAGPGPSDVGPSDGGGGSGPTTADDDSTQWNDPAAAVAITAPSPTITATPATGTTTAVASATVAPSLWTRFLTWLGFMKAPTVGGATTATVHGEHTTLRDHVSSVVRRARNGDQNAMALISLVRENAVKGHENAKLSYSLMQEYITKNPADGPQVGYEHFRPQKKRLPERHPSWAKAVRLSYGPILSNPRIAGIADHFGAEGQSFLYGVSRPGIRAANEAHHHGKVVGMARKLQAVRMPNSRISDYSPMVGWELGE